MGRKPLKERQTDGGGDVGGLKGGQRLKAKNRAKKESEWARGRKRG